MRRSAGALVLAKESSEDLVQSVCREVLQDLSQFEYRGEAAFRSWLYQAALRKIVDRERRWHTEKRASGREPEAEPRAAIDGSSCDAEQLAQLAVSLTSPSEGADRNEQVARLERGLAQLSPADRRVLTLVYVDGLSHAEVSERLGCTVPASRKALSRALARLSRLFA